LILPTTAEKEEPTMADASEDLLLATAGPTPPRSDNPTAGPDDDAEDGDEVVDYRFLAALASASPGQGRIPSRGVKDFEPHGTQLQSSTLDASRDAMHAVLREERAHAPDDASVAVWDPEGGGAWATKVMGKWAIGVGRSRRVPVVDDVEDGEDGVEEEKKPKVVARLWLLPEETLWLLERGTIDLRWPTADGGEGLPMSLQAAHAMLLGRPRTDGFTLERFIVYQYLKRAGFNVQRAEDNWHNVPAGGGGWAAALLERLLRAAGKAVGGRPAARGAGPLVTPGLYRDYSTILPASGRS
jgi:tRNA-splicing endonuclease subunit Sen54